MKADATVLLYTATTIVLWGGWGFFGKLALERGMTPLALFAAEIGVSVAAVAAWLALDVEALRPGVWNRFGVLSGAGLGLGLVTYYLALQRGLAAVVVPGTALYPAVAALLTVSVLGERLSAAQWVGLALITLGIGLLLSGDVTG